MKERWWGMNLRNVFSSLHLSLQLLLALALVFFTYLALNTFRYRLDLSQDQVYSLSTQTVQVLDEIKDEEVNIYAFFGEEQADRRELRRLLKEYAYEHPNLHFTFYDPDRSPAKTKHFQVTDYGTTVLEMGGRREKTKQVSEEAITNMLLKLWHRETKTVVFATGHGGPVLEEKKQQNGFGLLNEALVNANYEVTETVLARDGISKRTDLLILGGPKVDLLSRELEVVEKYLRSGGNVMILIDPVVSGEGKLMRAFLMKYGIEIGNDVIVDKISKLYGADYFIPLVTQYGLHSITKNFRLASFFPIARTVQKAEEVPEGITLVEIAWTGAGSWAENDLTALSEGSAAFEEDVDVLGPLTLAIAASGVEGEGRLVVFGDSDFATNGYIGLSGNRDFVLNSIAWLTGDEFAISIRPRERETTPLFLKASDQAFLFFLPVVIMPTFFLVVGTVIFFLRRRLV